MHQGQQRLELALLGVVALSLLLPQTAELERLTYRYLLELDGRTTVEGYSWGCVIDDVPRVKFSGLYRLLLRHHAGRSPDDYLVARFGASVWRADPPPAEAWRGHPLATWVALDTTDDLLRDWSTARITGKPEAKATWALELLREAQRREPDNGQLWATAALLVRRTDPAQARAWLLEAARRPRWDDHAREAAAYLQALLESRGLPPFDAHRYLRHLGPTLQSGELGRAVVEQLQREVDAPDGTPAEAVDLLLALAQALGEPLSAELLEKPQLEAQLEHRLDRERARRLVQDIAAAKAAHDRPGHSVPAPGPNDFWRSRTLATGHIFLAGLFLASLLLGLPCRFEGSSPRAFRLALLGCGALGAWVLFSALQPLNHTGGLNLAVGGHEPLLSGTSCNLLLAAASTGVILALQFGPGPARLRPLSLAALLAVPYLLTSWSASLCRTEYVAWVMSLAG